jgi:hypothetical protein
LNGDTRIFLNRIAAYDKAVDNVVFEGNIIYGVDPTIDINIYVSSYDSATGTKYRSAQNVIIRNNVFRNCRYVLIYTVSNENTLFVYHNVNWGYKDGGGYAIRYGFLDTNTYGAVAQDKIRMVASFDASVSGAQTKTVSNYLNHIPMYTSTESYQAMCSIRSAPAGWAGYVMCKPNASSPWNSVDVTLVTTATATGTVEVEVTLSEAEAQDYGYTQPNNPRFKR